MVISHGTVLCECTNCVRKRREAALQLAVRILARDGIRPLEGTAYSQGEREQIERAAGLTVAEVLKQ